MSLEIFDNEIKRLELKKLEYEIEILKLESEKLVIPKNTYCVQYCYLSNPYFNNDNDLTFNIRCLFVANNSYNYICEFAENNCKNEEKFYIHKIKGIKDLTSSYHPKKET
jgi:hypothetical protein